MEAFRNAPHYTYEDYLHWEGEWELWHGTAVSMSPSPGLPHGRFSSRLIASISNQLGANDACGECDVVNEIEWKLAEDLTLRPDISVLCRDLDARRILQAPELIIEIVSPRTEMRDRNDKRRLYHEHGVGRYLLADPRDWSLRDAEAEEQPEIHRIDLHDGCSIELPRDWSKR